MSLKVSIIVCVACVGSRRIFSAKRFFWIPLMPRSRVCVELGVRSVRRLVMPQDLRAREVRQLALG